MCVIFLKSSSKGGLAKFWNPIIAREPPVTLSNCQELCDLYIYMSQPWIVEPGLISSITSTNIQRITFNHQFLPDELPEQDRPDWTQLDNSLCRLVDRLERGLQLEVNFDSAAIQRWWTGELGLKKCLPRFYEKGGVSGGQERARFFPF